MKTRHNAWPRIEAVMEHYRFHPVLAFARHLGLTRGENLYQIKRGNNGISREMAELISARLPEVSKGWLLTGEGEMMLEMKIHPILKQVKAVPFYADFPVRGPPAEPDRMLYFSKELVHDADFAARCHTDELLPVCKKDHLLFLKRWSLRDPVIFGELYFVITDYAGLYRIIRRAAGSGYINLVCPNRKKYDTLNIPIMDLKKLYLVM
ncbi:MAG: hypothetical protein LUF87_09090 [Alistipes sp.]|nr:hypothetical protein [Alistipes sp.]MCD7970494.1 hypothetical protein [Alistipes sp.]